MTGIELTNRQLGTVLAALRLWQRKMKNHLEDPFLLDIATDGGILGTLDEREIDELCERLNDN